MHEVNVADIRYERGMLVLNTVYASNYCKHRNVRWEIIGDTIHIKAEKCKFGLSLSKGEYPLDEITEGSKEWYKPWPWSTKRQRSMNMVEFLKTDSVSYTSNNYTIVE